MLWSVTPFFVFPDPRMPTRQRQKALRSLGSVSRRLAAKYGLHLDGPPVTANSTERDIVKVYRQLCLSVHPDKGGDTEDFQALQVAYQDWVRHSERSDLAGGSATAAPSAGGTTSCSSALDVHRPAAEEERSGMAEQGAVVAREAAGQHCAPTPFRIHNVAVLLTYSLGKASTSVWPRFLAHVRSSRKRWSLRHWSATLEETDKGTMHAHLMLQFLSRVDVFSTTFVFEGVKPNARPAWTDYLGEAFSQRSPQPSFDRGFFYVWADKVGTMRMPCDTICVDGDYAPVWTGSRKKYKVQRKWAQSLWEAHKLSHDTYDELLFKTRQGVVGAKRNLDAVKEHEYEQAERAEMAAVAKRIRADGELFTFLLTPPSVLC